MPLSIAPIVMATALGGATSAAAVNLGSAGDFLILVNGTIGGATTKIQASPDAGATWLDMTGVSIAAAGSFILRAALGFTYRVTTTGGAGSSINVWAAQLT